MNIPGIIFPTATAGDVDNKNESHHPRKLKKREINCKSKCSKKKKKVSSVFSRCTFGAVQCPNLIHANIHMRSFTM